MSTAARLSTIDLGFLYTQWTVGDRKGMMKSLAGNYKPLNFADLDMRVEDDAIEDAKECTQEELETVPKDRIISELDGNPFFLSDLAIDQSDSVFHSLKDKRFEADVIRLLVNTSYGIGFGAGFHETYTVSGLPVDHYKEFKPDITQLFMGKNGDGITHSFKVQYRDERGKDISVLGSVRTKGAIILPQPFGGAMGVILDEKGGIAKPELAKARVLTIDPGFGTTDMYATDSMTPVEKYMFSTKTAMNSVYKLVGDKLREQFSLTLPLYKVERYVRDGKIIHKGKMYNLRSVIRWAYGVIAEQLVSEIVNKVDLNEIDHIIIVGGGGIALGPYLKKHLDNVVMGNQWSVTEGYRRWGLRKWKDVL